MEFLGTDLTSFGRSAWQDTRRWAVWNPAGMNNTTLPGVFGTAAPNALGTATARAFVVTNILTRQNRLGYVSAATAGSLCGHHLSAMFTTGSGDAFGGFNFRVRFGISDAALVAGARMFVGVSAVTPSNVNPPTLLNSIGIAQVDGSANFNLVCAGAVAQPATDTGITLNTNEAYDFILESKSNSTTVDWWITTISTGATIRGTFTTVPIGSVGLSPRLWRCNNATATAVGVDICSWSVGTL
jgi:hypothetical protein